MSVIYIGGKNRSKTSRGLSVPVVRGWEQFETLQNIYKGLITSFNV